MRFSYFGSGKFSAVDLVFYYYLAGVFELISTKLDKTLELTICPRHRDMFDGTKGFSTTGKLSPTKIPSSRLASPGSTRMGQKDSAAWSSWCSHFSTAVKGEHDITLSQTRQLTVLSFSMFRNICNGTFATTRPKSSDLGNTYL